MTRSDFRSLKVWQKANEFFLTVVEDIKHFPKIRVAWILEDNLVRAANSIGANIAEGYGRKSNKEFRQFLGIAKGSVSECTDQYVKIGSLGYLSKEKIDNCLGKLEELDKMLRSLMFKVNM